MATPVIAHPLTMRFLSVMLIASFVLGLLGVTGGGLVRAENVCWWVYQYTSSTCTHGICMFPAGSNHLNYYYHDRQQCCNAYNYCWWTNTWQTRPGPAGCTWCN